jgi:hypothetical protein
MRQDHQSSDMRMWTWAELVLNVIIDDIQDIESVSPIVAMI